MYKNDYGRFTLANTGIIQRAIYQKKYPKTSGVKDTMAAWDRSQYVSLLEFNYFFLPISRQIIAFLSINAAATIE